VECLIKAGKARCWKELKTKIASALQTLTIAANRMSDPWGMKSAKRRKKTFWIA